MKNNYTGEIPFLRFVISLTESSVLVSNLRVHIHTMFLLYDHLKDGDQTPTPDEVAIASGKRKLDTKEETELIEKLKKSSENIKKAFQNQRARAIVSESVDFSSLVTYDSCTTGPMGPRQIRAVTHGMGRRL